MTKPLVIFGAGQIAELAHYYFTNDSDRTVAAFTIDREYVETATMLGLPVVAFDELEQHYPADQYDVFVALSYSKANLIRKQKVAAVKTKGYALTSYISSYATVLTPRDHIGENCFILEDNTIQPFTRIGDNVTLWSGNHIGHHSTIADHCFVSSHVVVCGNVTIEECCFLGVNATIRDGITVGSSSIIGASAWVDQTVPPNSVCTPPASSIRARSKPAAVAAEA